MLSYSSLIIDSRRIIGISSESAWHFLHTDLIYSELLGLPRKFTMTDLNASQAESSIGFNDSWKPASFMSSLISRPLNIPAFSYSMLFHSNFSQTKPLPPLSNTFTKFFMSLSLMCTGGSNTLLGSTKGRTERCVTYVLILSCWLFLFDIV